jgi:hypothetical protein
MEPPSTASPLYKALHATALGFIKAQTLDSSLPSLMDFEKMHTYCSRSFHHSWGHKHAVSLTPPLQRTLSFDGFVSHLENMLPKLASWRTEVTDVVVDEERLKVVLRISFFMHPKGPEGEDEIEEVVENDLLWVLEMMRVGDGVKISGSKEFVDGVAAGRLRELMTGKV